jgi:hypothetical protein
MTNKKPSGPLETTMRAKNNPAATPWCDKDIAFAHLIKVFGSQTPREEAPCSPAANGHNQEEGLARFESG